jgi:hypothetical protein
MNLGAILQIAICLVAIFVIMTVIKNVNEIPLKAFKIMCMACLAFSLTRYLTLICYTYVTHLAQLNALRYFYFATLIGLTFLSLLALWFISPFLRDRISCVKFMTWFLPCFLIYLLVILGAPKTLDITAIGYRLVLNDTVLKYVVILEILIKLCIFVIGGLGFLKYKNPLIRTRYTLLLVIQIPLILDGLSVFLPLQGLFVPFTVSEVLAFLGLSYILKNAKIK